MSLFTKTRRPRTMKNYPMKLSIPLKWTLWAEGLSFFQLADECAKYVEIRRRICPQSELVEIFGASQSSITSVESHPNLASKFYLLRYIYCVYYKKSKTDDTKYTILANGIKDAMKEAGIELTDFVAIGDWIASNGRMLSYALNNGNEEQPPTENEPEPN